MDKFKEGLNEMTGQPQRGAEEVPKKGQEASGSAKEKTQGTGEGLKSTVEENMQKLEAQAERFMPGSGKK